MGRDAGGGGGGGGPCAAAWLAANSKSSATSIGCLRAGVRTGDTTGEQPGLARCSTRGRPLPPTDTAQRREHAAAARKSPVPTVKFLRGLTEVVLGEREGWGAARSLSQGTKEGAATRRGETVPLPALSPRC